MGDQFPEYRRAQDAVVLMINRAAAELEVTANIVWIPTKKLNTEEAPRQLEQMDALWASPGSPYVSLEGILNGIRFARESGWPFLGTCAGFQHTVLEYARNVVGIKDAASEEYEPEAANLLVTSLVCPIASKTLKINLAEGSKVESVYGNSEIEEYYYCNFGLNPRFQSDLEKHGLKVTGKDQNDEPRVLELLQHRFFIATLFVPGASAFEGVVKLEGGHALVKGFLAAAAEFREVKNSRAAAIN